MDKTTAALNLLGLFALVVLIAYFAGPALGDEAIGWIAIAVMGGGRLEGEGAHATIPRSQRCRSTSPCRAW